MKYIGKSLDGFSYAIKSLLDVNSVDVADVCDPDCLSLRAFSFLVDGDASQWFRTAFSWECYMGALCHNLGLEGWLKVCELNAFFEQGDFFDRWFLVGEVADLAPMHIARNLFYRVSGGFYLCKMADCGDAVLCDPIGSPCRFLDFEMLRKKALVSKGFSAWIEHGCGPVVRIADSHSIVKQFLTWRYGHPELLLRNQLENLKEKYSGGGREVYSMRYAITNFQIQFKKAVEFFYHFGMIESDLYEKLYDKLNHLLLLRNKENFYLISEVDEMLWSRLEKVAIW